MEFARAGFHAVGIDVDPDRVHRINAGESYITDVGSDDLASLVRSGNLTASNNPAELARADVIFICVPTPATKAKAPDVSYIEEACEEIARHLRLGQLIVLESTTYPGTTEEVMLPILQRSGLMAGRDFFVAFSPERVDPGNKSFDTRTTPKVVGGITPLCAELTKTAFQQFIDAEKIHIVSSPKAAEMTKLLENTFRAVNIALVNELTVLCDRMGINIWEVIDAASTKPFGYMPFYPGPGVGGHCIPVDPYYLSHKAREYDFITKFIEHAAEVNLSMPDYVTRRVAEALNECDRSVRDARILVLGAAFKRDVNDARNSPALRVMELLLKDGARVSYNDPYIPQVTVSDGHYSKKSRTVELQSVELTEETLSSSDCVVITAAHRAYDFGWVVRHAPLIVDTVNATRGLSKDGNVRLI